MYYKEHNPPHFHFTYGEYKGVVYLKDGIIEGRAPGKVLRKVNKWYEIHKKELIDNWNTVQNGKNYNKIKPLK